MKTQTDTTEQLELPFEADDAAAGSAPKTVVNGEGADEPAPVAMSSGTDNDLDALRIENEQLKTQIRFTQAHRQITGELERAGARSPELLFEAVKGGLQFGDDGEVV